MKNSLILLAAFICFCLIYVTYVSRFELNIFPPTLEAGNPRGYYDYSGVINVHTSQSTGSRTFEEILSQANNSNVDFIVFTDLNQLKLPKELQGYHGRLLVFIDGEFSYLNSRLLLLGSHLSTHIPSIGQLQAQLADRLTQEPDVKKDGLLVLAHPFKYSYQMNFPHPEGLDGIEIINLRSIWQQSWFNSKFSFLWTLLIYPFHPQWALVRLFEYPEREIDLWDQLNKKRKTLAFAGTDAQGEIKIANNYYFPFPSYSTLFSVVRNHVLLNSELTGDEKSDRQKVFGALESGRSYLSLDMLANPKGFLAQIEDAQGKIYPMGSQLQWQGGQSFVVHLPQKPIVPFDVMIFKDGKKMMISNSKETRYQIPGPGIYRALVRVIPTFPIPDGKKWVPWIFTNSFYLN